MPSFVSLSAVVSDNSRIQSGDRFGTQTERGLTFSGRLTRNYQMLPDRPAVKQFPSFADALCEYPHTQFVIYGGMYTFLRSI